MNFDSGVKTIQVVASEEYKDFARKLAHEISKHPNFKSAFWTVKQYEDNEFKQGENQYSIFIGSPSENELTNSYIEIMENKINKAGACFGYDGTKAIIYGEGKIEAREEFKKLTLTTSAAQVSGAVGSMFLLNSVIFTPILWLGIGTPLFLLLSVFRDKKMIKQLRMEQTKKALALFMGEHFDKWVGL